MARATAAPPRPTKPTQAHGRAGASAAAPAPGRPAKAAGKSGGGLVKSIITACVILVPLGTVALPTAILFVIGLVPTVVALLVDKNREKYAAISVGSLNFCGVMPAAFELWRSGHSLGLTFHLLAEPLYWLSMFGGAALGWMIHLTVPSIVAASIAVKTRGEIADHKRAQEKLREEWGPDVADAV